MQAAWYEKYGPAAEVLKLGELPDPEPGPGEVRVKLVTSGINPSDVKSRAGVSRPMSGPRVVPDSDGAGVIDRIGPGIASTRLGQRVWTFNAAYNRTNGTSAQYVTLPDFLAPRLSEQLDFDAGACLGVPVMTAHRAVFSNGPVAGLTLLVTGAAGAVGHYAVQLAKWGGATVIATISGPEKAAHARAAGADHVINYKTEAVVDEVKRLTGGAGVDRIVDVDFGTNLPQSVGMLKINGSIASYASMGTREPVLPYYTLMWLGVTLNMVLVYSMPDYAKQAAITDIAQWVAQAKPIFNIAARFDLKDIVAAHEMVESGAKIGQVLLLIPQ